MNILKLSSLYNNFCNNLVKNAQDLFYSKIYFWLQKTISELMDELNFINKDKMDNELTMLWKIVNFEKNGIIIPIEFILKFTKFTPEIKFTPPNKTSTKFIVEILIRNDDRQIVQDDILDKHKNKFLYDYREIIFGLARAITNSFYKKMEYKNPKVNKRFDDYYETIKNNRKKLFEDKNLFKNEPWLFLEFKATLKERYDIKYTEDDYNEDSLKNNINKFYNSETAKMFSEKERQEFINKLIEQDEIYHKVRTEIILENVIPNRSEIKKLEINKIPKYEKRPSLPQYLIKIINNSIFVMLTDIPILIDEINKCKDLIELTKDYSFVSKENIESYLIKYIIGCISSGDFDKFKKYLTTIIPKIVREFIKTHQDAFDLIDRALKQRIKEVEKYANESTSFESTPLEEFEF